MEAKIIKKLRSLLEKADMETCTERELTAELKKAFGDEVATYKSQIKAEIQRYLEDGSEEEEEEEDGESEEEPEAKPAGKKRAAGKAKAEPAAKHVKTEPGEVSLDLSGNKRVSVSTFRGSKLISIREYFTNDAGELLPGKKGISLSHTQWALLEKSIPLVSEALSEGQEDFLLALSAARSVTIVPQSKTSDACAVDIREFYEKEGERLPGKKGIRLSTAQWEALCGAAEEVSAALGTAPAAAAPAAAAKADPSAAGPSGEAGAAPATGGDFVVQLSNMRRLTVGPYAGKLFISLREYYELHGEVKPGKKGISLTPEQWQKLASEAEAISEALAAKDEDFSVQIAAKRKASISVYQGRPMVNIREYYEKGGQVLPGAKGLSLPGEQWAKVTRNLEAIQAAVAERS